VRAADEDVDEQDDEQRGRADAEQAQEGGGHGTGWPSAGAARGQRTGLCGKCGVGCVCMLGANIIHGRAR
jgi:hypothetical protein